MEKNWTPIPDATETLADGTLREWACRDLAPTPTPAPVTMPAPGDVVADPPSRPGHGWRQRRRNSVEAEFGVGVGSDARDAVAQLRADNERAGREFQRNTITTAKRLGIWQWVVLVFGLGSIGWGAWVSIRAGAGEYPQTQPNNSARSDRERESGARRAGGGVGGSGVNHSRDLLIEWFRTGQIGSMTDDEIAAARRAVEADR